MVPSWGQLPLVGLATAATIIASQAVITGAYSLTHQALQIGCLPRVEITHTSESERGQIYVPAVNWWLLVAVVGVVLAFRSSSRLAAAYGIAVTGTMLTTTLLMYFVARYVWRWSEGKALGMAGGFLIVDLAFFAANTPKIAKGAWFPLIVGATVYTVMTTWRHGRSILYRKLYPQARPLEAFLNAMTANPPLRVPGTAVYMAAPSEGAPHALVQNLRHNKVLHERVVILTILIEDIPRVNGADRYDLHTLAQGFHVLSARFGFMEFPDIPALLLECRALGLGVDLVETSFFLSRLRVIPTEAPGMALWREHLFAALLRNAAHAPDFFRIPTDRVMELDIRVEI
jgi:KUP system potassium uptake protein